MQQSRYLMDADVHAINQFVRDMAQKAAKLPTHNRSGLPKDDECSGSYFERELFTGVTLCLDWAYLDAPSSTLLIDNSVSWYDHDDERTLDELGGPFEDLAIELTNEIGCGIIEYDEANSRDGYDVWNIHRHTPF